MRLLFLSNGHGEDVIGSRLALELANRLPEAELFAFPLVGTGTAWSEAGLPVLGEARALPSLGLTFHSVDNLLADLRAGLLGATVRQFRDLRRTKADAVIVVGDIWSLFLSMFVHVPRSRRFALQTLISVKQHSGGLTAPARLFMERITAPERLLQRRGTARVWVRDAETAAWLNERLVPQATYSGSFIADSLPGSGGDAILLLPGSRSWAEESLAVLLETVALLPEFSYRLAWAHEAGPQKLPDGWQIGRDDVLTNGRARVRLERGRLVEQLAGSRLAFGTAGTAVEQAAAAGLPILSFEIPDRHTAQFLKNQERLLHGALHIAGDAGPQALAARLKALAGNDAARESARKLGLELTGRPGGLARIALEIAGNLSSD